MHKGTEAYNKIKKRFGIVFNYSIRSFVPILFNSVLSLVIIRNYSEVLWGEIVSYLIIFNLSAFFITWGNKQYLLREFSLEPKFASKKWLETLTARVPLLIIVCIVIFLIHIPPAIQLALVIWQIFYFLNRSFEIFILFQKKFLVFWTSEIIISFIFLIVIIFQKPLVEIAVIIYLFAFFEFVRLTIAVIIFREKISKKFLFKFNYKILLSALPFFLLGLVGLLQSRLDIYLVAYLLIPEKLAAYQVLINFLILLQAGTGFIIQPFLKEIYRLPKQSIKRLSLRFTLFGIVITPFIIILVFYILSELYELHFGWNIMVLSYLYILPLFYYTIRVYLLYKEKKENYILVSGVIILVFSLPVNIYLINNFDLLGAILGGVIIQWLTLAAYVFFERKFELI